MSEKVISQCTACPANLYNNCQDSYGPEYVNDGDQTGCGFLSLGCQLKCRWTGPTASAADCCLGNPTGQRTCNSNYTLANSACDATMQSYCAQGANIINDSRCKNWASLRPAAAASTIKTFCTSGNNLQEPACQSWCQQNPADCDPAAIKYCNAFPNDPFCACIKSAVNDPKYGINPPCVDPKCIQYGYETLNMRNTACPNIINCDIQTTLQNSGISIGTAIPLQQNCGNTGGSSTGATTGSNSSNTTTSDAANTPAAPSTKLGALKDQFEALTLQWRIFALLVFLLVVFLVIYLAGYNDDFSANDFDEYLN